MRISSTQFKTTMALTLQQSQGTMSDLIIKMGSGKKLLRPSDDPIASLRLLRLERDEAALAQYRENISTLNSRLSTDEALLDGMKSDTQAARDLLVWAADGNNSLDDLAAMATSLESLRDSLLYSANSKDGDGRYRFSGTATGTAAMLFDETAAPGTRYSFGGNENLQEVLVGDGVKQPANTTLSEMADLLNALDKAVDSIKNPVPGADVSAGLRDALGQVDAGLEAITGKMARIGGAQNTLSVMDQNHENVSLANQGVVGELGSLDYASAYLELNTWTMALQASQKAYGKISSLTLFDVV
ncbi:flagellar hook-associated protein FlgL [Crenobacter caeni]|uniref:Flagellar hook-associated protein 3 n=1 Tax=Crenobacter caeni TaxID=2705474 RepID=A0A6B2KRR9_9NEIS|nr:flagellar hook-associated protein FlgL [Crenobacter caeni]NDV12773.1 flagellar hook-associated protein 3 [Crenobacter caeni]